MPSEPIVAASVTDSAKVDETHDKGNPTDKHRGARFWLIFLSLGFALFLSPLELTSVSTALPTIIRDLHGTSFIWVTSAYTLASTAILPFTGGLAESFGRKPAMLIALGLFALGSALCGTAQRLSWLIAARTIQGMGGGGILSLTNIIISDLVPLRERGAISGVLGLVWALAAALGPLIGGALTNKGQWRWLFYLNLPICGIAFILILLLLDLPIPPGTFREKLSRLDWCGNFIIIASSSSVIIALSWAGVQFSWSSPQVLVPLLVGLAGMGSFVVYEKAIAKYPMMPFSILSNRTTLSGYMQTFFNPVIMLAVIYYLPAYFQACKGASAIRSAVDTFGLSMVLGPVVILTGWSVTKLDGYRIQAWIGWAFLMVALGLLSTVKSDSSVANVVGYSVLVSIGGGIVYAITYFPVLAPLQVSQNAHALALFAFWRSFAGVWGVTIGGTILQNQLRIHLPTGFSRQFNGGGDIAYSIIPIIQNLSEPERTEVRKAFAESIAIIWEVLIGVAGVGLISSAFMRAIPMHKKTDEKWTMTGQKGTKEGSLSGVADASNAL